MVSPSVGRRKAIHVVTVAQGPGPELCRRPGGWAGEGAVVGHSLSSLKRKASWYSFMYCVERDSSRKRE